MSKDIDNHNRLTYDVYRPIIITDPDGGEFLYVKVSLVFCTDHKYRDTRKTYSLTQKDINYDILNKILPLGKYTSNNYKLLS